MIDAPGCYADITIADYHADPCSTPSLNASVARILIDRSPAHARLAHPKLNPHWQPSKYDHTTSLGTVCHKLVLGKGRDVAVVEANDLKSKAAREAWDVAFEAGLVPILEKNFDKAEAIARAARAQLDDPDAEWDQHDRTIGVEGKGQAELVWVAQEPNTGLLLRCMTDWCTPNAQHVYDYKGTHASAAPHSIGVQMERMNYAFQDAFYERVLSLVDPTLESRLRFRFLFQEFDEPHPLTMADGRLLRDTARRQVDVAIAAWARCIRENEWPGYPKKAVIVQPVAWSGREWCEREERAADGAGDWIFAGR
jgi:hypothetical protein